MDFDAATFHQRLAETIAWCTWRLARSVEEHGQFEWRSDYEPDAPEVLLPNDLDGCLRSPELEPSYFFNYNAEDHLKPHDAYRLKAVDALALKRAEILRQQDRLPEIADGSLCGGRLLAYEPNRSLWDGPSGGETDGYIEVTYDVPPWDSWICFVPPVSCLISFVPPALVAIVSDGIAVSASGCIFWLDEPNARRYTQLDALDSLAHIVALTRS